MARLNIARGPGIFKWIGLNPLSRPVKYSTIFRHLPQIFPTSSYSMCVLKSNMIINCLIIRRYFLKLIVCVSLDKRLAQSAISACHVAADAFQKL